uniref:Uncharacterized protein n=1 Tax=Anguilla anguilla TaxID=7936 RepID=A0A0E9W2Y9_ANGAN
MNDYDSMSIKGTVRRLITLPLGLPHNKVSDSIA